MKSLLLLFILIFALSKVYGQNVGIGTATPNSTARLDVVDTERGVLVPRLTQTQRDAITSPAQSLLIFNLTSNCYEWWDNHSNQWIPMSCGGCISAPSAPTANAASSITSTSFTANWTASGGATSYRLDVATDMAFTSFVTGYNDLNVGNVTSYNVTGLNCNTTYYYRVRACNDCGCSSNSNVITITTDNSIPSAPTANSATSITNNSFTANWSSVSGATSYRLDVSTNMSFTSFVTGYNDLNVGNVTSYNVTGLNCNTTYYYRVRACNSCGCSSNSNVITVTTSACSETPACIYFGGGANDTIKSVFSLGTSIYYFGTTASYGAGQRDIWIARSTLSGLYPTGNYITFGTSGHEFGSKMIPTSDGGFIFVGTQLTMATNHDIVVFKLDNMLSVQWTKRLGGNQDDFGMDIKEVTGGYIIAGTTNSFSTSFDAFAIKLDGTGNVLWSRTVGGTANEYFASVAVSNTNTYAFVGFTGAAGGGDVLFTILNDDGTLNLIRSIGATDGGESGFSIIFDNSDNNFVVAGVTGAMSLTGYPVPGYENFYMFKITPTGSIVWSRSAGEGATSQRAYSIKKTSDGGYFVVGVTGVMGYVTVMMQNTYVVKLNNSGVIQWQKVIDANQTPNSREDMAFDFMQFSTGELGIPIVSRLDGGFGNADIYFHKIRSDGTGICCISYNGTGSLTGGTLSTPTLTPTSVMLTVNTTVTYTLNNTAVPMQLPELCAVPIRISNDSPDVVSPSINSDK